MRRLTLALIAALTLTMLTAACRDGASPPASTGTTAPATAPAAAPTDTPLAGTPAAVGTETPAERVASTAAIPTDELPEVVFKRADGSTVSLAVEVPSRDEYTIGLSGRTTLDDRGMLFYYPGGEGNAGFWMSHTHIDLAIAFVTVDGVVSEIDEMTAESLDITRPAEPYEFAVEAPAGWFAEHGVAAGDAMRLEFNIDDYVE